MRRQLINPKDRYTPPRRNKTLECKDRKVAHEGSKAMGIGKEAHGNKIVLGALNEINRRKLKMRLAEGSRHPMWLNWSSCTDIVEGRRRGVGLGKKGIFSGLVDMNEEEKVVASGMVRVFGPGCS